MRSLSLLLPILLAACTDDARQSSSQKSVKEERTSRHPEVTIRTATDGPVVLPSGFSLYPAATLIEATLVERKGHRRGLVIIESPDAPAAIVAHYRREARSAGATIALDISGKDVASLGGTLRGGGRFSLTVHDGKPTRAELAFE